MTNSSRIAARWCSAPLIALAVLSAPVGAQTLTGTIVLRVTADSAPIAHAAIVTGTTGTVTDKSGSAAFTLPTGRHTFRVTPVGFHPESLTVFVGVGTTNVTVPVHHAPAVSAAQVPSSRPASRSGSASAARTVSIAARPASTAPATPNSTASVAPSVAAPPASATVAPPPAPAATAVETTAVDDNSRPTEVVASRNEHRSSDAATYVEVSDRQAIDEQIDRSPGNIADLLGGFSGVRVQPLSAGSAGIGIRIRGMPGRYAKILTDGLPLLGATPEGQDLLQTSILGVERVEVTPGVTSALYGPTSLSGGINVVSAGPTSPSTVVVNGTTHEASDVAVFQTQTFSPQWSATLLASRDYQNPGDPDGDGWAEVPGYKRVMVQPHAYWTRSPTSSWFFTGGWMTENRRSGTFGDARLPDFNRYSDDADTRRGDAGSVGRIQLDTNTVMTVRASITREWRTRWYGTDEERDRRNEIFGDVGIAKTIGDNVLTGGLAIDRDQYAALDIRGQDYRYTTPALYAEHTWAPDARFAITSSARLDLQSEFGDFVSPRVSVLLRPTEDWSLRISRANGVYAPTPITDETESYGLAHLERSDYQPEHALGWSVDVDHTKGVLDLGASGYRTVVTHPLVIRVPPGSAQGFQLVSGDEPSITQGIDLRVGYRLQPFRFTANYSYIDARRPEISGFLGDGFEVDTTLIRAVPFDPRHSVDLDWSYEREQDKVLGFAVHFTGRQTLADSTFGLGSEYVTLDARFEKHIRRAVLFAYGKDLTGVHQLQYAPVLRPSSGAAGQWVDNVWAPLDGRTINLGVRLSY